MPQTTRNDEERWDDDGMYVSGGFVPLDPDREVRVIQQHPSGDVAYVTNIAGEGEVARWACLIAAAPELLRACKAAALRIEADSRALGRGTPPELRLLAEAVMRAETPKVLTK